MGKFDGVLLVSDFDDTFLGSDRTVPARNYRALEYFLSEGGYFTFASGRNYEMFTEGAASVITPNALSSSFCSVR